jgi:hypothetical protein
MFPEMLEGIRAFRRGWCVCFSLGYFCFTYIESNISTMHASTNLPQIRKVGLLSHLSVKGMEVIGRPHAVNLFDLLPPSSTKLRSRPTSFALSIQQKLVITTDLMQYSLRMTTMMKTWLMVMKTMMTSSMWTMSSCLHFLDIFLLHSMF